jgi:signal transduction histidine kinase
VHAFIKHPYLRFFAYPARYTEDIRRRAFILDILLLPSLLLFFVLFLITSYQLLVLPKYQGISPFLVLAIFSFLFFLEWLSRSKSPLIAGRVFIVTFFLLPVYAAYRWGVDLPAGILFYTLVIIMAGIVINARFAFLMTAAVCGSVWVIGYLQQSGMLRVDRYWVGELWGAGDIVLALVLFFVIAIVSWLSNKEMEKSLARAILSEAELKEERNLLEVKVEERTFELRKAELENLSQVYRFVEFGRLASGLFHDLTNPLTSLTLNLTSIANSPGVKGSRAIATLKEDVARAEKAAAHMQALMDSLRKHLAREGTRAVFIPAQSMKDLIDVLMPYARSRSVRLSLAGESGTSTYGDEVAFIQAMTNIIANAIESYLPLSGVPDSLKEKREVIVKITPADGRFSVSIRDFGFGIPEEQQQRVFEPFFTTKKPQQGLGIGLSLSKRIIEKEFGGNLSVESAPGKGSVFTIYFPIREP